MLEQQAVLLANAKVLAWAAEEAFSVFYGGQVPTIEQIGRVDGFVRMLRDQLERAEQLNGMAQDLASTSHAG
jgi:hypothetical protein